MGRAILFGMCGNERIAMVVTEDVINFRQSVHAGGTGPAEWDTMPPGFPGYRDLRNEFLPAAECYWFPVQKQVFH